MKFGYLATAAIAASILAVAPASAVDLNQTIVINPITNAGDFGASHGGAVEPSGTVFTDTYSFLSTLNGTVAAAAISISVSSSNFLGLTTAVLNGVSTNFNSSSSGGMFLYTASVMAPTTAVGTFNTLLVNGSVSGSGGTYNGNVSIAAAAVPEAATWAMMLVGFGGIGCALRAGRRKVVFA